MRAMAYAIIIAFWVATLAINAPGHLSFDSVVQLHEARTNSYAGFHPPLMSYLMMLFDSILPGTGLFLAAMQALFFGTLLLVVWAARDVRPWTPLIIALGCLHPFVVVYQGIVWKDVLFANLAVFAFALLCAAQRFEHRARWAVYACSLPLATCAGLVRQNGAIVLVVLAIAITYLETRPTSVRAHLIRVFGGAAAAAVIFWSAAIGTDALIRASAHTAPRDTLSYSASVIFFYDIGAMLAAGGDPAVLAAIDAPAVQADAVRYYAPDRHDWLALKALRFHSELRKLSLWEAAAAWGKLIAEDPAAYLRHRLAVFGWMLWPPEVSKCLPVHVGVSGRQDHMAALELHEGLRPSDRALLGYTLRFMETPLYRHGLFLALAVVLEAVAIWLGSVPAAALVAATILFTLSWAAVSVGCDMRYLYFLRIGLLVAAVMLSVPAWPSPEEQLGANQ